MATLHDDVEATLSRLGEFAAVPDVGAKIAENAARLAGVFHVLVQGPEGTIDGATMEGAAAIAIWHLNEARRIVGANKRPELADAELLLQWLLARPEDIVEPRDILRLAPDPLRDKGRRNSAIDTLLEKYWVRLLKIGKAHRIMLNPKARHPA